MPRRHRTPLTVMMLGALSACADKAPTFEDASVDVVVTDTATVPPLDARRHPDVMIARRDVAADADVELREDCEMFFDDDGDGRANENCVCLPGSEQMCFL